MLHSVDNNVELFLSEERIRSSLAKLQKSRQGGTQVIFQEVYLIELKVLSNAPRSLETVHGAQF